MRAQFLDSYFGTSSGVGICGSPAAGSDFRMFNEVRDTAILKLAGQGPVAGLFRDLAYDADADSLTGSAAMDRGTLTAFGSSAATLGPEGEAGAWQALADLTHGFESVLGSAGALPTLFAAVCGRGAELAGRVGEGMRTLGIDPGSLKVKLPGLDGESEEGDSEEGEDGVKSADAGRRRSPIRLMMLPRPTDFRVHGRRSRTTGASTLDWNIHAARRTGRMRRAAPPAIQPLATCSTIMRSVHRPNCRITGRDSFSRQGTDLFQMPMITGFSIFDCFAQPCLPLCNRSKSIDQGHIIVRVGARISCPNGSFAS